MSSSPAARLCQAHLHALGPDADPGSLADVIWLGLQLTLRGAAAPDGTIRPEDSGSAHLALQPGPIGVPDAGAQAEPASAVEKATPDSLVPIYPSYFTHPFGKIGASRIKIPAGEPLPQRLHLERALKPFKRRLPSRQQRELDPIATAEASAEWRSITPVYRATPERWFEVAILAESSDAMHVWDATLLELRRMLARHGAFRRVRLWRYTLRKDLLVLSTASAAMAAPRILVDPQGRRLCWFVTTGTSPLWQHAALTDFVATLGRHGPTAIVQLMPHHTWPHTLLGDASEEALGQAPGTPTARLWLRDPFTGEIERATDALTVPVTSLEPARLEAWARFSMASRRVPHPAIRLQTAPQGALSPATPHAEVASPRQRIGAFRAIASPSAFQLLRLLAGMPLSLPVMRLMQMGMPDRAQIHLAEILLSGLIERVTPPDADLPADLIEYDFVPGIREELLDSLTLSEGKHIDASMSQIAEQARRFVEAYADSATASFPVLVRDSMGDERLLEQAKSFLEVSQNFRPLRTKDLPQTGAQSSVATTPTPSPAVRPKTGFDFLSEEGIKEQVLRAGTVVLGTSELRCLLFFANGRQHSWLVASDHAMALVLDDAGTRRNARLVQYTSSWLDALPVVAEHDSKGGVVKFGDPNTLGWYYSPSLFSSPRVLEDRIAAMVPGGRDGALMQLRDLALEYDEIRASVAPSQARTGAMQDIVDRIAIVSPLWEPDLTLATQSRSAGIQLIAIVSLQYNFDPAHMDWLFDCIAGDQAFLAFQAALALRRAVRALSKQEEVRMHKMAVDTKRKLQAAGLNDINVHRLLDEFAALTRAKPSLIDGGETRRILISSTGWEFVDYRAQAVQLLERLGHEIVDDLAIESASELQTRLNQFEACDMVLLLVGTRNEYGQAARQSDPNRILLVELEYREAVRLHKPIMVFMLEDESFSGSSHSGKSDRMERFRQTLLRNHMVEMVHSPKEFEESLYRALRTYFATISQKVEQVVQSRNRKPEDMRNSDPPPAAGSADSTPADQDPHPEQPVELGPHGRGVGRWVPEEKHLYLTQYIHATRKAQAKFKQRVLIDPFCGPGRIQVVGESFTRHGGTIAAYRQSVASGAPFTRVLIGDIEAERVRANQLRLAAAGATVQGFVGPATETVDAMVKAVPFGALTLAYIDPYNLEYLSFSIIERLSKLQYVDFAIHFSLMDLTRNIDMELDPQRDRFDHALPGWRSRVPTDELSKSSLPGWFFSAWCDAMRNLGFKVSGQMPQITDGKGRTIYRMVFLSRHELPDRIWGDIARGRNLNLFDS